VDLPAHGRKAGEVVELGGLDALELERDRHFDPNVDEKAVRRQEQVAARF
jgi:anionic cell wall polymer biosynthesis LytR-Cps2A-Psr (LCP) family protein